MFLDPIEIIILLLAIYYIFNNITNSATNNDSEHFKEVSTDDGFDLKNVETLTFFKDQFTTGNRTLPIRQLNCVSGNACDLSSHYVNSVQCKNSGQNYNDDTQWACRVSSLPSDLMLGETNVSCEGLRSSEDKLKLKGSCGLEYSLNSIDTTERVTGTGKISTLFIVVIFILLIVLIISSRGGPLYYSPYSPYAPYSIYSPTYYPTSAFIPFSSYDTSSGLSTSTGFGSTRTR